MEKNEVRKYHRGGALFIMITSTRLTDQCDITQRAEEDKEGQPYENPEKEHLQYRDSSIQTEPDVGC